MIKLRFSYRDCARPPKAAGGIAILLASVLLLGGWGLPTVYGASEASGFRIFTLKHISAEQGKKFLGEVGVGTVSQLSGPPALLVTGKADDVAKAKAILDITDAQEEFAVRSLPAVSGVEEPPAAETVAEKVGNISVGTFSSPPKDTGQARAIVDVHNGSVGVVAPSSRIERIVSAVAKMLEDRTPASGVERGAKREKAGAKRAPP